MIKCLLCLLFPLSVFSQYVDYKSLSDEQLQVLFQKELLDMEVRGATPDLIFDKFVIEKDVYLQSREAYYRFLVHTEYLFDKILARKMENGTDQPSDFEKIKKFKQRKKHQDYQEYLAYKKTDKAKEAWENNTQDGILKLVVEDHQHYTDAEQKRYDGLIILLNRDPYFSTLHITDGKTTDVILPKAKASP